MRQPASYTVALCLLVAAACGGHRTAGAPTARPAPLRPAQPPSLGLTEAKSTKSDVPYVPTPPEVVERMLVMAGVTADDVVYDLGSGDGRIVIAAARKFGARGVGVEINAFLVEEARQDAKKAGVADRVQFLNQDLFQADIHEATVVTLYLLPAVNLRLRPKLLAELEPGTRIVSRSFDMDDWKPERIEYLDGDYIYSWTVPERANRERSIP